MGVLDSGVEPDKLLALFGTDPVHLTETGYNAISSALGDELDTPCHARQEPDGGHAGSRPEHQGTEATSKRELDCRH